MADISDKRKSLQGKDLSVEAQIQELKRELALRENVYPKQIERGKLDQDEANYHYYLMKKALENLVKYQGIKQVVES